MKTPAQPNQSLINGVTCLQTVIAAGGPLGSREVARHLSMEHTRVSRLLGTFCSLGLLEQAPDRRYQPGPGIHVLAAQSLRASGLLKAAIPVLRDLDVGSRTLALGVLWLDQVCYLYYRRPGQTPDQAINGRELYPADKSSIGRLLLAFQKKSSTFTGLSKSESAEIRGQGFALLREKAPHVTLAVGIGAQPFAGLAAAGPMSPSETRDIKEALKRAADAIVNGMNGKERS